MEIQRMKHEIGSINMKILFNTKIGMRQLIKFLTTTKIATRKWILGTLNDEVIDTGGWGEIDQEEIDQEIWFDILFLIFDLIFDFNQINGVEWRDIKN